MKNGLNFEQKGTSFCEKPMKYKPLFLDRKQANKTLFDVAPYDLREAMQKEGCYTLAHLTDIHFEDGKKAKFYMERLNKFLDPTLINFVEIGGLISRSYLAQFCARNLGFSEFPGLLIFSPNKELIFAEGNFEEIPGMPDAHFRYLLNTLHKQLPAEITKDLPKPLYLPTKREVLYNASPKEFQTILDGSGNYEVVHLTSTKHCYWCEVAKPHIRRLEQTLKDKNIGFLEVDLNLDLSEQRFLLKNFSKEFGVKGRPSVILFSPEGEKIDSFLGYEGDPKNPNDNTHYNTLVSFLEKNIPGFKA